VKPLARIVLLGLAALVVNAAAAVRWTAVNRQPAAWYAAGEARALAGIIVQYQTPEGGWPKNHDMTEPPSAEFLADKKYDHRAPTIDNGGTTTQLELLARVIAAGGDSTLRAAFERGFDYLLAAQYPNGGWPQYFPLIPGYYSHITYNDDAMVRVLGVLRAAAAGDEPYAFVDAARRERAAAAVAKAIGCILRTQVKQNGRLTAWCAQHDETTFAPAWARNFEPPSLSGNESVGLVRFLMGVKNPSPEIIAAVQGAVTWLESVKITGLRVEETRDTDGKIDRHAVADPAGPVLWARFYDLETNRPIYMGRDKVPHSDFNEIERERRGGYSYLGTWPAQLLAKDYPRWRQNLQQP
jgi:PelA/Pel-15E family pectate lyase